LDDEGTLENLIAPFLENQSLGRGGGKEVWERHYESLLGYKTEHGDIKVPRAYAKNPGLGDWVFEQRRQLKLKEEGKPSQIDEKKKTKLDRVGLVWKIREVNWNYRFEQLIEFKKEHGHTSKSRQV